jgi:hypothetical protein
MRPTSFQLLYRASIIGYVVAAHPIEETVTIVRVRFNCFLVLERRAMESNHTPESARRLAAGPQATLGSLSWAEAERVELSRVSPRSVFETGGLASLPSASVGPAGIEPAPPGLHAGALPTELRNLGGPGRCRTCGVRRRLVYSEAARRVRRPVETADALERGINRRSGMNSRIDRSGACGPTYDNRP